MQFVDDLDFRTNLSPTSEIKDFTPGKTVVVTRGKDEGREGAILSVESRQLLIVEKGSALEVRLIF